MSLTSSRFQTVTVHLNQQFYDLQFLKKACLLGAFVTPDTHQHKSGLITQRLKACIKKKSCANKVFFISVVLKRPFSVEGGQFTYYLFVCVFIQRERFISLGIRFQGTDQRCCVEDVSFLCQVPSLILQYEAPSLSNQPLYPVRTLEAGKATT